MEIADWHRSFCTHVPNIVIEKNFTGSIATSLVHFEQTSSLESILLP